MIKINRLSENSVMNAFNSGNPSVQMAVAYIMFELYSKNPKKMYRNFQKWQNKRNPKYKVLFGLKMPPLSRKNNISKDEFFQAFDYYLSSKLIKVSNIAFSEWPQIEYYDQ